MGSKNKQEEDLVGVTAYPGREIPRRYLNLVRSRWVRSYKRGNGYMKIVHPPAYYFSYNPYVNSILNRPDTVVRIAALEEDDDVVLGFSVVERNILHYVHVPKDYRRQGIGAMLTPSGLDWFTHLTEVGMKLWSMKMPNLKFNCFL